MTPAQQHGRLGPRFPLSVITNKTSSKMLPDLRLFSFFNHPPALPEHLGEPRLPAGDQRCRHRAPGAVPPPRRLHARPLSPAAGDKWQGAGTQPSLCRLPSLWSSLLLTSRASSAQRPMGSGASAAHWQRWHRPWSKARTSDR